MSVVLSPLAVSVLALLVERPMHPYEVMQTLEHRGQDADVKVRTASLYHAVDRLLRDGFVAAVATERAGNRPERTTYRITAAGRAAMEVQVADWLATPRREYPVLPVAIAEAHFLERDVAAAHLRRRRDLIAHEHTGLAAHVSNAADQGVPRRMLLGREYTLHRLSAELDWIDSVLDQIDDGTLDWTEPHPDSPQTKDMT